MDYGEFAAHPIYPGMKVQTVEQSKHITVIMDHTIAQRVTEVLLGCYVFVSSDHCWFVSLVTNIFHY
jgi:hypothetical protein